MNKHFDFPVAVEAFVNSLSSKLTDDYYYNVAASFTNKLGIVGEVRIGSTKHIHHVSVTFEFITDKGINVVDYVFNDIKKMENKNNVRGDTTRR